MDAEWVGYYFVGRYVGENGTCRHLTSLKVTMKELVCKCMT